MNEFMRWSIEFQDKSSLKNVKMFPWCLNLGSFAQKRQKLKSPKILTYQLHGMIGVMQKRVPLSQLSDDNQIEQKEDYSPLKLQGIVLDLILSGSNQEILSWLKLRRNVSASSNSLIDQKLIL